MSRERKQYFHFVVAYNIVLLIPMVVISISVMSLFWKQQMHNVDIEANTVLERQCGYWKQQLSSMRAFIRSCKFDKKYNGRYSDEPTAFFEICEELSKQEASFPFVDAIYMYDTENDFILTSDGKIATDIFFSSICRMNEDIFNLLLEESKLYAYPARLRADSREGIVFVAPFRTWGENKNETKFLIYSVKSDTLKLQFGKMMGDGFTVLMSGDDVLYTTFEWTSGDSWQDQYNNLLSEGEYVTYSGDLEDGFSTTIFIPKESLLEGMGIYLKGYSLWFLCSLVIGMLLLLYFTRNHYEFFKKLINNKAELIIERDRLRKEGCLYELLLKTVQPSDELMKKCLENNIYIKRKYKFFAALPEEVSENFYERFKQLFNLSGISDTYEVELVEGVCVYLICTDEAESVLKCKMKELSEEKVGIGSLTMDVKSLRKSYEEAIKRLNTYFQKENGYPEREISSLERAVGEGNLLKGELLLEEICNAVEGMDDISAMGVLWNVANILQLGTKETIDFMKDAEGSVCDRVKQLLVRTRNNLSTELLDKEHGISYKKRNIEDVIDYVHEHYLDDNFSVKYMAFYFDTSVSNISHFFKKNTGVTISQYVENIKLESAKKLLKDSDKRITEIACILGYANSTVFIEMFKRYEGMTPGSYRELLQKENGTEGEDISDC